MPVILVYAFILHVFFWVLSDVPVDVQTSHMSAYDA